MKCYRVPQFENDIKTLRGWCSSIDKDIYYIKNLFKEDYSFSEEAIPNLKIGVKGVFKVRMVCNALPFGKRKGPRLIYKKEKGKWRVIFFLLYSHNQSKYKKDSYVLNEIRKRVQDFTEKTLIEM